jgi:hypothetical protein
MDACVFIDPYDAVLEEYEQSGVLSHSPYCPALPDLVIASTAMNPSTGEEEVTIRNDGEGTLEDRSIAIWSRPPGTDGENHDSEVIIRRITLASGETGTYSLAIPGTQRNTIWSLHVDPENQIVESDEENNRLTIDQKKTVFLAWQEIRVPYDARNDSEFTFTAQAVSGPFSREIITWRINQDIDWGSCFGPDDYCILELLDSGSPIYQTSHFDVYGEEALEISVTVTETVDGTVTGRESYFAEDDFGAGEPGPTAACVFLTSGSPGIHPWTLATDVWIGESWFTLFNICQVE